MAKILIYGVNGFSGKRVARYAKKMGDSPIVAGRNKGQVEDIAKELNLESRVFDLLDEATIDANLKGIDTLLNLAGPYIYTAEPLVKSCIKNKVNYLDITGEGPVITDIMKQDGAAKKAGIVLLPAVGFDVVPTDCLALKIKEQMPDAQSLEIILPTQMSTGNPSRGTLKTVALLYDQFNAERINGEIVYYAPKDQRSKDIKLPTGRVKGRVVGWGDIYTAYETTGIPNISDYFVEPPKAMGFISVPSIQRALLNNAMTNKWILNLLDKNPDLGPTREMRRIIEFKIWAIGTDSKGRKIYTLLSMGDPLRFTYRASYDIAKRVTSGKLKPGYYTPAQAFGSDYILNFRGAFYVSYDDDFEEMPDGKI